jgi:hypothetical protein
MTPGQPYPYTAKSGMIEVFMASKTHAHRAAAKVVQDMPDKVLDILTGQIGVNPQDVYRVSEPLGMDRFLVPEEDSASA